MKFKYIILLILFIVFSIEAAYGQWDAQISQYWRMKNFYNPAFIGDTPDMESSMLHRRQWVGITNAPVTSIVSLNRPISFLGKEHGIGAIITNEKVGLFSNTYTLGQYTYKVKFKNNKFLHIGLQGGMMNVDFDAAGIHIPTSDYHISKENDPSFPTVKGDKIIDAGFGIAWIAPRYYVGLSATHLFEPTFEMTDDRKAYIARTYYLMGGYNIRLNNPLIELQPSAFFKTDAVTYQMDITAKVEYNKMFNGGISWRKDEGFVFLLGVKIRNIDAGYSYDLTTSDISAVSNGSHELFIRYSIPLQKKREVKGTKSIRIL
ncbi:type IX secretion system membrane protein PorP/SprF [Dysgonomonas sp. Marseille-P4677]|uniref:PorP/SprF family type IX secretion system membrane protein n=1 Tax=Dysgonomonas sp. Marseille-P4677 TaxID=2364790 RepID=UPI001911D56E|nr:type IX secretion system membrane protein PorP/SprF [Dysgonomonas sp. Marseille-P4677]MBK5721938.1 type IX secretion system membrane protein PorP/SprF [Dysgonomonas sp. Marseille-P4677]